MLQMISKYDVDKPKRTTKHTKGKPLNIPIRTEERVSFVADDEKRRKNLSRRKRGRFVKVC